MDYELYDNEPLQVQISVRCYRRLFQVIKILWPCCGERQWHVLSTWRTTLSTSRACPFTGMSKHLYSKRYIDALSEPLHARFRCRQSAVMYSCLLTCKTTSSTRCAFPSPLWFPQAVLCWSTCRFQSLPDRWTSCRNGKPEAMPLPFRLHPFAVYFACGLLFCWLCRSWLERKVDRP